MGKYKRLGINTVLIFIGNMGSWLIGLVMLPFYTRWLGPSQYGVSDILNTYATVLLSLITCSIAEALFVFPKEKNDNEKASYFSTGVLFVIGMSLLTAALFYFLKIIFKGSNSFLDNIWLLYILVISQIISNVLLQFTRSIDKIKVYSATGFLITIATASLGCLIVPQYGLKGYIWSIAIANLIGGLYTLIFSDSIKYITPKALSFASLKEMLSYSLPLVPSAVTWWVIGAMNRPIMESYIGLHDIGIFAVASKFPNLLNSVFVIFGLSWQISVLEEYGKPDYPRFFNNMVRGIFAIIAIGVIGITVSIKQLITLLAADDFYEAWILVPLLTVGTLLGNLGSMFGTNFLATKKSKYMLYTSLWASGAALLLNFILIPRIGVWGAVLSTVGSMLVLALTRIYYSRTFVEMTNISHYLIILAVTLSYIGLYLLIDNMLITIIAAAIAIGTICGLEKNIMLSVIMQNKKIQSILYKFKR